MEVLHNLRARGFERPILVLTAQDAVDAKVKALRAGADDYVTKPFAFEELLARVEALGRRPQVISTPMLQRRRPRDGPEHAHGHTAAATRSSSRRRSSPSSSTSCATPDA